MVSNHGEIEKQDKISIIFITDDDKKDWWWKNKKNETIGPHPQLIEEFVRETNHWIHIYSSEVFLKYAQKSLGRVANTESVKEIKSIREKSSFIELIKKFDQLNKEQMLSPLIFNPKSLLSPDKIDMI